MMDSSSNQQHPRMCDASKLKPGDWLSRISYMKVLEIKNNGYILIVSTCFN
jgi:hypothetical protein